VYDRLSPDLLQDEASPDDRPTQKKYLIRRELTAKSHLTVSYQHPKNTNITAVPEKPRYADNAFLKMSGHTTTNKPCIKQQQHYARLPQTPPRHSKSNERTETTRQQKNKQQQTKNKPVLPTMIHTHFIQPHKR
jgi:hypothetical protein